MNKQPIEVFDYAAEITKAIPKGILLTAKAGDRLNTMTIGWGTLGVEWGVPLFVAYVRESRFTRQLLDENPEFTVNVPLGDFDKQIISFCGSKSGRDVDKFAALGLTAVDPQVISVPGIAQLPLTLECRIVYRQLQDAPLEERLFERYYPQTAPSPDFKANRDLHVAYCGQIVAAYRIEP